MAVRSSPEKVHDILAKYNHVSWLADAFSDLANIPNVQLFVDENKLKNYGQSLATACETVAVNWNNYYIENFENIICNYFVFFVIKEYSDLKVANIKKLVYNYVYDEVFLQAETSSIPVNTPSLFKPEAASSLQNYLNPLILEVKTRIPAVPVTKATLNESPFKILPIFRYILGEYEAYNIAQASEKKEKAKTTRLFSLFSPSLG
ncbi:uncharacterized protein BX663DRAFT_428153 [Cokeromyces recurvatus]|uniref:uncharacterized protein n=1 Tax=Cokeromyces recurvatus TaxID=90255 RepID=UPI002220FFAB|nr:uncharacterized protein BX663DRAFT_428153 [Cokeromyces recurvatus]KAI7906441.1 hypothetical protein BX663DRAFT_428153 [Cokeromyces recurvatus]